MAEDRKSCQIFCFIQLGRLPCVDLLLFRIQLRSRIDRHCRFTAFQEPPALQECSGGPVPVRAMSAFDMGKLGALGPLHPWRLPLTVSKLMERFTRHFGSSLWKASHIIHGDRTVYVCHNSAPGDAEFDYVAKVPTRQLMQERDLNILQSRESRSDIKC